MKLLTVFFLFASYQALAGLTPVSFEKNGEIITEEAVRFNGGYGYNLDANHVLKLVTLDWPPYIDVARGKSQPERILETSEIINKHQNGALRFGASLQSHDTEVLKNIKRKNLPLENIKPAIERAKRAGMLVHTFWILGYPGETYEEMQKTIDFENNDS